MTPEEYDNLWESIEDKLDDLYDNQPNCYDLENYELEFSGHEVVIEGIEMGYDHNHKAHMLLNILKEEGIIKVKDKK